MHPTRHRDMATVVAGQLRRLARREARHYRLDAEARALSAAPHVGLRPQVAETIRRREQSWADRGLLRVGPLLRVVGPAAGVSAS